MGVGDAVLDSEMVGVGDAVLDSEMVGVGDAVLDGLDPCDSETVGVTETVDDWLMVGVTDALGEGLGQEPPESKHHDAFAVAVRLESFQRATVTCWHTRQR